MTTYTTLEDVRDALADITGVVSCKIGIEPNIAPSDYPMIRLVPSRITPGRPYGGRTIEALVYFGTQTVKSEGLETVYENLFGLETEIIAAVQGLGGRYRETITDEDRLEGGYKLMTIRCEITQEADAPAPPPSP